MQLEFDFTFNCFCLIIDDYSGEAVCGGYEECFFDEETGRFYPTAETVEEHAMYDCTPVCQEAFV